jgi:hypothetical protein
MEQYKNSIYKVITASGTGSGFMISGKIISLPITMWWKGNAKWHWKIFTEIDS